MDGGGSKVPGGGLTRACRDRRSEPRRGVRRFAKKGGLACLVAAVVLLQCSRPVQVGQQVPDFTLESLKGGSVSLEDLRGKVVFLHFWATWCPPCLVELPGLLRFFKGLDKKDYALLAVCVDNERPGKIRDFLRSWGMEIPVYLDPGGTLARRLGTFRFPETYVLDPEGRVCRKVIGAGDWKMSKWARILHTCAGGNEPGKREAGAGS